MNFNFRKIGSVIASAVMLGSTIGLAAANYPAPFVKNGAADVAIVWGSTAASTDLSAVIDISTSLSTELAKQTATGGTTSSSSSTSGGEAVRLDKSSTKFHLGNGILDVVSGTLTSDDFTNLLADGVFVDNDNDEFDFTQKVVLTNQTLTMFNDNDYKEDTPAVGMKVASSTRVLNYTLDFSEEPAWTDLETADLTIMGKSYYILDANAPTNTSLVLLDSASTSTIAEGETKTITVGNKTYEVTVDFVSSTPSAKLIVNGVSTNNMANGATEKLSDGSYVGVKEVLYTAKDTGTSKVELSIGSGKLTLTDNQPVKINDDTISGLRAGLGGGNDATLTDITLEWTTEDDEFAAADKSILMPGFEALKLSYGGLTMPAEETIAIEPKDTYVVLNDFPLKDGTQDINLVYGNSYNWTGVGKDATNQLRTTSYSPATLTFYGSTDDYFVVSYAGTSDAESYLLKAENFDTSDGGLTNRTDIVSIDGKISKTKRTEGDLTIGSATITVGDINVANRSVILTAGAGTSFNTLYSNTGLKVFLPWFNQTAATIGQSANITENAVLTGNHCSNVTFGNGQIGPIKLKVGNTSVAPGTVAATNQTCYNSGGTFPLVFMEEDKDDVIANGAKFNVTLGWNSDSTPKSSVTDVVGESVTFEERLDTEMYESWIYSSLATQFLWDKSPSQDALDIVYHGSETFGDVYVTDMATTVSGSTTGTTTTGSVKALGKVDLADTQASSVSGKNLIVVGGSCINTVASQLLGGAGCAESFTTKTTVTNGQFLIETFARTDGKVATLVAGYNAVDTTNAAKYLTTQQVDTTVGKKYIGTSATSATLQTTTA